MNRRTFLRAATLGSLLPLGLAKGFDFKANDGEGPLRLATALANAAQVGKPLLVLIGPETPPENMRCFYKTVMGDVEQGMADLFQFGGPDMWTALALCHVHVSFMDEVREFAAASNAEFCIESTTWALIIDASDSKDGSTASVQGLNSSMPDRPQMKWNLGQRTASRLLTQRVSARSLEVTDAIAGTSELVAKRADTARAAIGRAHAMAAVFAVDAATFEKNQGSVRLDSTAIDLGAAVVLEGYASFEPARATLRRAARARLWLEAPQGAAWAIDGGCGISYLNHPDPAFAFDCGMGFTPEGSRRFLLFYIPDTATSGEDPGR